jgi:hypothetical protein
VGHLVCADEREEVGDGAIEELTLPHDPSEGSIEHVVVRDTERIATTLVDVHAPIDNGEVPRVRPMLLAPVDFLSEYVHQRAVVAPNFLVAVSQDEVRRREADAVVVVHDEPHHFFTYIFI